MRYIKPKKNPFATPPTADDVAVETVRFGENNRFEALRLPNGELGFTIAQAAANLGVSEKTFLKLAKKAGLAEKTVADHLARK